jgi:hypothetical protein
MVAMLQEGEVWCDRGNLATSVNIHTKTVESDIVSENKLHHKHL